MYFKNFIPIFLLPNFGTVQFFPKPPAFAGIFLGEIVYRNTKSLFNQAAHFAAPVHSIGKYFKKVKKYIFNH